MANSSSTTEAVTTAVGTAKKPRGEAQPYREGKGWAIRSRYKGHDIYVSGQRTAAKARKEAKDRRTAIDNARAPRGLGPEKTTVAQALQDYSMKRLKFKKGAVQEAVRINQYLRAAKLATLVVTPIAPFELAATSSTTDSALTTGKGGASAKASKKAAKVETVYFEVTLQPYTSERVIPQGLHAHRAVQLTKTANAQKHRAFVATRSMAEICNEEIQDYLDALRAEGAAPATLALERSVLRVLFNHAFKKWHWERFRDNPAVGLDLPQVNNARKRKMSEQEQTLMDAALADCRNKFIVPVAQLLRETAMRSSEPLAEATWSHVNWERKVLRLQDDKAGGGRDVPLSPLAIEALRELQTMVPFGPTDPIITITYESLRAAWKRACERAGIENLNLHDLRATAASRMAIKTGNRFLVKALTGHKTDVMVDRYICVDADDVVAVMHAEEASTEQASDVTQGENQSAPLEQAAAKPIAPSEQTLTMPVQQFQEAIAAAVQMTLERLQSAPPSVSSPAPTALAAKPECVTDAPLNSLADAQLEAFVNSTLGQARAEQERNGQSHLADHELTNVVALESRKKLRAG